MVTLSEFARKMSTVLKWRNNKKSNSFPAVEKQLQHCSKAQHIRETMK